MISMHGSEKLLSMGFEILGLEQLVRIGCSEATTRVSKYGTKKNEYS